MRFLIVYKYKPLNRGEKKWNIFNLIFLVYFSWNASYIILSDAHAINSQNL